MKCWTTPLSGSRRSRAAGRADVDPARRVLRRGETCCRSTGPRRRHTGRSPTHPARGGRSARYRSRRSRSTIVRGDPRGVRRCRLRARRRLHRRNRSGRFDSDPGRFGNRPRPSAAVLRERLRRQAFGNCIRLRKRLDRVVGAPPSGQWTIRAQRADPDIAATVTEQTEHDLRGQPIAHPIDPTRRRGPSRSNGTPGKRYRPESVGSPPLPSRSWKAIWDVPTRTRRRDGRPASAREIENRRSTRGRSGEGQMRFLG